LTREEWAKAQGKKIDPSAFAAQAIEAKPPFGQIKPGRGQVLACLNGTSGEDVADIHWSRQEAQPSRRRKRNPGVQMGDRHTADLAKGKVSIMGQGISV
jgi:hypothetical protein